MTRLQSQEQIWVSEVRAVQSPNAGSCEGLTALEANLPLSLFCPRAKIGRSCASGKELPPPAARLDSRGSVMLCWDS